MLCLGGLRKTKFLSLERISAQANFIFGAYNLIPMGNIFNWNPSTAQGYCFGRPPKRAENPKKGLFRIMFGQNETIIERLWYRLRN